MKALEPLPAFTLQNQYGQWVNSASFLGKPVVIYFYPKDNTPGCTAEACSFRDAYEQFLQAGIQVAGISSNSVASHAQFAEKHKLPFMLLSDEQGKVRRLFQVPKSLGILPGRVTYIFNEKGELIHQFQSQFQIQKHIQQALQALQIRTQNSISST